MPPPIARMRGIAPPDLVAAAAALRRKPATLYGGFERDAGSAPDARRNLRVSDELAPACPS